MSVTHALSLTRPWPFAFTDCGKRVENRDWKPPVKYIGARIALHAAQSWDAGGYRFIQKLGFDPPDKKTSRQGEIFAVAKILTWEAVESQLPEDQRQWFFGPFGWVLGDLLVLPEPVFCKGALGLWKMPDDVATAVDRQL